MSIRAMFSVPSATADETQGIQSQLPDTQYKPSSYIYAPLHPSA